MSKTDEMHPDSEPIAVSKKEKRDKKEKKEKKRKTEEPTDDITAEDSSPKSSKKRKREILPDEIEIDVSLPEPASKKAARKAKKAKTLPAATAPGEDANGIEDKTKEQAGKRSEFSVWIGNLPWSATKESLRTFLAENSEIKDEEITRIHMPAPKAPPRPNWTDAKPHNKGFAYVDFSTQLAMYSAIALTETRMDRRPLLIKNSKNFEGRPDKPKEQEQEEGATGKDAKAPSRKIFVGNLGFETSKEDLIAHFAPCGPVESIHMATFEDTGKCKGYAWVTFEELDAAAAAVKGYVFKDAKAEEDVDDAKMKKRKYKLNKLLGRDLRCEFAEDSTTRYQKRFGKEKPEQDGAGGEGAGFDRPQRRFDKPRNFKPRDGYREPRKVDPRTIAPGAAHSSAPRASAAIVKSEGKKTTFD